LIRGIFDKQTRRKPLAAAADALSYGDWMAVWYWTRKRRAVQQRKGIGRDGL